MKSNSNQPNDYKALYYIGKMLEDLPGDPTEICDELSNILSQPQTQVSSERSHQIEQIRGFLKDNDLKYLAREAIQRRINILKNSLFDQLPEELKTHILFFVNDNVRPKYVSRLWKTLIEDKPLWRRRLCSELGISKALALEFSNPELVYRRYMLLTNSIKENLRVFSKTDKDHVDNLAIPLHFLNLKKMQTIPFHDRMHDFTDEGVLIPKKKSYKNDWSVCQMVLASGNVELLKYTMSKNKKDWLAPTTKEEMFAEYSENEDEQEHESNHLPLAIKKGFNHAIGSGSVTMVRFLVDKFNLDTIDAGDFLRNYMGAVANSGSVELIRYFLVDKFNFDTVKTEDFLRNYIVPVVSSGSVEVMRYFLEEQNIPFTYFVNQFKDARDDHSFKNQIIMSGSLPLMKYMFDVFAENNPDAQEYLSFQERDSALNHTFRMQAIQTGNLSIVKYIIEEKKLGFGAKIKQHELLRAALYVNNMSIVLYLTEGCDVDPSILNEEDLWYLNNTMVNKSITVNQLKYLIKHGLIKPNQQLIDEAVMLGNLALVRYLNEEYKLVPNSNVFIGIRTLINKLDHDTGAIRYLPTLRYLITELSMIPEANTFYFHTGTNYIDEILQEKLGKDSQILQTKR